MAWTELHDSLPDHPKTKVLVAELGSTKPHAIGLLCALWCFTLRFGKDGVITSNYWRGFAADMGEKNPDATLAALEQAGWVATNGGEIALHDWNDYAGRLEHIRRKDREKKRFLRGLSGGVPQDVPRDGDGQNPPSPGESPGESAQHNQTQPNQPNTTQNGVPAFEAFWDLYPENTNKRGREHAEREYYQLKTDWPLIHAAVATFAAKVDQWPQADRKFAGKPVNWLKDKLYLKDPSFWDRGQEAAKKWGWA